MTKVPGANVVFAPRQLENQASALYARSKRAGLENVVISRILDDHDLQVVREAEANGLDTSRPESAWS
ncbi:hypothetical protein [Amycolatopsis sp. NPDC021455]|uniref:hypothetical protein n=1 Tax=Amycolatopsis sp. NPDC021455 TaxID=3154901 RepID=UPI0033EFEA0B